MPWLSLHVRAGTDGSANGGDHKHGGLQSISSKRPGGRSTHFMPVLPQHPRRSACGAEHELRGCSSASQHDGGRTPLGGGRIQFEPDAEDDAPIYGSPDGPSSRAGRVPPRLSAASLPGAVPGLRVTVANEGH